MIKIITILIGFMIFIVFMLFIVPIWLGLHYRWKASDKKNQNSLPSEAVQRIQTLQSQADKLEQRVKVLESILDNQIPDWRKVR